MLKQLKAWRSLIRVNAKSIFVSTITSVICVACSLTSPIALSNFIGQISEHSFTLALIWLGIDLMLKLLEQLSWHFNYSNFVKLIGPTYMHLQQSLTLTALKPIDNDKKNTLDYVIGNDLYTISSYIDKLIIRLGGLLKLVTVSVVIFLYSYSIGTIILAVSVLGYFILSFYMTQKKKTTKRLYTEEKSVTEKFNEIFNKKDVIKKYNLENAVIFEENRRLYNYVESYSDSTKKRSIKDNLLQIYWYTMLAVMFAILVYEYKQASLTLTIFLAIYNYLLMYSKITENVFDLKLETVELGLAIERYNDIINIESEEKKESITKLTHVQIEKINPRANAKEKHLLFKPDEVVVLKDPAYKKYFTLPPSGIAINNISIEHLDYDQICKIVTQSNEMFDDTIIENLQIISCDLKRISNLITLIGLTKFINSLEDKEYTNIIDNTDPEIHLKFNLVRAILSDAKVIFLPLDDLSDDCIGDIMKTITATRNGRVYILLDEKNRINRKKLTIVE